MVCWVPLWDEECREAELLGGLVLEVLLLLLLLLLLVVGMRVLQQAVADLSGQLWHSHAGMR